MNACQLILCTLDFPVVFEMGSHYNLYMFLTQGELCFCFDFFFFHCGFGSQPLSMPTLLSHSLFPTKSG